MVEAFFVLSVFVFLFAFSISRRYQLRASQELSNLHIWSQQAACNSVPTRGGNLDAQQSMALVLLFMVLWQKEEGARKRAVALILFRAP